MIDTAGRISSAARLADESAIRQILALHCRGVDRADHAALTACYWPDATVLYGPQPAPAHQFCDGLVKAIAAYSQTHHQIGNVLVDFEQAEPPRLARVETYLTAYHYREEAGAAASELIYLGRYLDRFEKRGDMWKISQRTPVMSWSQNLAASHDPAHPALAALTRAGRFPYDPIY
jgi:ketosteroid isomerase-like protein